MGKQLMIILALGALGFVAGEAAGQTASGAGQARDVYWLDSDTTLPETGESDTVAPALDGPVTAPATPDSMQEEAVVDLDAKEPDETEKPPQKPSEVLRSKPTPKPQKKAATQSRVESAAPSRDDTVSYEGTVSSVQTLNDNTLEIQLEQENGEFVVGYVKPGLGLRVPGKGSLIRMRGELLSKEGRMDALEVSGIDRLRSAQPSRQQAPPTRRYVQPTPNRYYYPPRPRLWP